MAEDKVKVVKLPYMGPPKDDSKEKEHKRVSNTVPASSGTRLAVPMSPEYRDRNYGKGGDVQSESNKMTKKSTPKQIADEMETEQNYPVLNKYNKVAKAVDRMDEGPVKQVARGAVLAGTVPAGVAQIGHSLITGKRGRSKEDTDELEREIGRGQRAEKKAKGGKVSSASSRGDGCAQRGKTKGRMV
jgi:hypothetical protein